MSYKRGIENTHKAIFYEDNNWNIPSLHGVKDVEVSVCRCVAYNYCSSLVRKDVNSNDYGVHFFLNDYQFERLWRNPEQYILLLSKFKYVCSPDYSLYTDHPRAVQLFNHYKKHWLGAYWERNGITVIPTICWSDSKSFEWCFDGEPKDSIVAISTKGTQGDEIAKERFYAGYYQMLKRLNPSKILLFGKNPGALEGNVIEMGYEFNNMTKQR